MGLLATLRRASLPVLGPDQGEGVRPPAVPLRFVAVAEALRSGADPGTACDVVGRDLARDGADLAEALAGLHQTWQHSVGVEPAYASVRALTLAWSEETLGFLHRLSCEDPLSGLATLAHLRTRLAELFRAAERSGTSVAATHALVVVDVPGGASTTTAPIAAALRLSTVADGIRTVFDGAETLAAAGGDRVLALVERDAALGRRVGATAGVLEHRLASDETAPPRVRCWIEGLPGTDGGAGPLLDELTRR